MVSAIAPPVVSLLPDTVLETMAGSIVNSDVQASNVPVYAGDTFIAGAKSAAAVRPWAAARRGDDDRADLAVGLLHDHVALRQGVDHRPDLLAQCLLAGFDEVLALGGDGRAVPATFGTAESHPSSRNGSAAP